VARMEEEEKKGAPEWITTFADMMSLLLTFFVFILTFSTIETDAYQKVEGALQGGLRISPESPSKITREAVVPPPATDHIPVDNPGAETPPDEILEEIEEDLPLAVRELTEEDEPFAIERLDEGILIRPKGGVFAPSSARLDSRWSRMVRAMADTLSPHGRQVVVRGYTDARFLPTGEFPTAEDVRLARAVAVASELVRGGLAATSVEVTGGGLAEAPHPNDTPRERARNRTFSVLVRVESGSR